jgi:quinol monooxygenase YgiN
MPDKKLFREGTMLPFLRSMLGLALVVFFTSGAQTQDANSTYVVSYFEVAPSSQGKTLGLLRSFETASRKEPGNLRFEALQGIHRANHFLILEVWKDQKAQDAHAAAAGTKDFRDKLTPLLITAYDERPHGGLAVGASGKIGASAVFAVTHVDLTSAKKDDGIAMSKALADQSRKDSGNLRYDVLQQGNRPNHLTLVEIWSGDKALEGHDTSAHTKKYRNDLTPMSGSLYDQRLYKTLQ